MSRPIAGQHIEPEGYYPLVLAIARKFKRTLPPNIELDDIYQCGIVGLLDAIEKFDNSRGVEFGAYARHRIWGAIVDELRSDGGRSEARKSAHIMSLEQPVAEKLTLQDVIPDQKESPLSQVVRKELLAHLHNAIATLDVKESQVVTLHCAGKKMHEIGRHMGLSEGRISQLRSAAISKLRANLADQRSQPAY